MRRTTRQINQPAIPRTIRRITGPAIPRIIRRITRPVIPQTTQRITRPSIPRTPRGVRTVGCTSARRSDKRCRVTSTVTIRTPPEPPQSPRKGGNLRNVAGADRRDPVGAAIVLRGRNSDDETATTRHTDEMEERSSVELRYEGREPPSRSRRRDDEPRTAFPVARQKRNGRSPTGRSPQNHRPARRGRAHRNDEAPKQPLRCPIDVRDRRDPVGEAIVLCGRNGDTNGTHAVAALPPPPRIIEIECAW